ncbi:hypothetical protein [Bradyrhizobium sp. CCBAU 53421]|uniref:hypothetical protein n=1 Tax=Bradyrhizobium sp. CCBAU 53421 TaxID=1325120 RepID=UPI00188AD083|nr:hypothetical protein [Bradyrhizobium sp. CCBAU 53421]
MLTVGRIVLDALRRELPPNADVIPASFKVRAIPLQDASYVPHPVFHLAEMQTRQRAARFFAARKLSFNPSIVRSTSGLSQNSFHSFGTTRRRSFTYTLLELTEEHVRLKRDVIRSNRHRALAF